MPIQIETVGGLRQARVTLPSGHTVLMRELTIGQEEQVASQYTFQEVRAGGAQRAVDNACIEAAIIEIDGKPINHAEWQAKEALPRARDWEALALIYATLASGADEIQTAGEGISIRPAPGAKHGEEEAEVALLDSRKITLRELTPDEIEALAFECKYAATDWMRERNDLAALAITRVDGQAVDRKLFDPRVEFPGSVAWLLLKLAYSRVNGVQEDQVADFFPAARRRKSGIAKSDSSCVMGISNSAKSPGDE